MNVMRWSAALIGGAILLTSAQSYAQTCPIADTEEEARTLARENFSAAQEAYELGRPLRALNHYQCSFQLFPHHATLYNLAVLAQGIGEVDAAISACREFLQRYPDATQAADITQRLVTLEAQQAAAQPPVEPTPPPPVEPTPPPPPVEPTPPPPVEPTPPPPPVEQNPPPPVESTPPVQTGAVTTSGRKAAWAMLGLGVAVAATGGVFMGMAANRNAEFHQEIDEREISLDGLNAIGDQGWSYYVTSWILMGAGAAMLVTSIVLFAAIPGRTERASGSGGPRLSVLSPYFTADNGFGLSLRGTF